MKHRATLKAVLFCSLMAMIFAQVSAAAQVPTQRQRGGRGGSSLYGDWQVKMQFGERQMESILSFSRDQERKWNGSWISFWGDTELTDVTFEEDKLSFSYSMRNRQGEPTVSKFAGTVKEGILAGTLTSSRGDTKMEGKRASRTSPYGAKIHSSGHFYLSRPQKIKQLFCNSLKARQESLFL